MGARMRMGIMAGAAALLLSGAVAASADDAPAPVATPPAPLVEVATCAAPTPVAAPDGRRTDGATQVSLLVPAVTRLRVAGGAVVAAATNTGCAPRSTDQFVVGDRVATASEVAVALRARSGDWTTPGAWHDLG